MRVLNNLEVSEECVKYGYDYVAFITDRIHVYSDVKIIPELLIPGFKLKILKKSENNYSFNGTIYDCSVVYHGKLVKRLDLVTVSHTPTITKFGQIIGGEFYNDCEGNTVALRVPCSLCRISGLVNEQAVELHIGIEGDI